VGQHVALHLGWIPRISRELDELGRSLGRAVVVSNASANGRTTRLALEAMPYELQSHSPDIVLIQFGLNDCNYWASDRGVPRVSRNAFIANLTEIVTRSCVCGAKVILLHTNHPTTRDQEPMIKGGPTLEESNRLYNAGIRELAASLGSDVHLCDFERAFNEVTGGSREKLSRLLLEDGLHLSKEGHDLYFDYIYEGKLKPLVQQLLSDVTISDERE
jgi:lysophospholipase L1-like esterase